MSPRRCGWSPRRRPPTGSWTVTRPLPAGPPPGPRGRPRPRCPHLLRRSPGHGDDVPCGCPAGGLGAGQSTGFAVHGLRGGNGPHGTAETGSRGCEVVLRLTQLALQGGDLIPGLSLASDNACSSAVFRCSICCTRWISSFRFTPSNSAPRDSLTRLRRRPHPEVRRRRRRPGLAEVRTPGHHRGQEGHAGAVRGVSRMPARPGSESPGRASRPGAVSSPGRGCPSRRASARRPACRTRRASSSSGPRRPWSRP